MLLRCAAFTLAVALVAAKTPNEKLKTCCKTLQNVDKNCVNRYCDFNALTQQNILNFLDHCPSDTVGQMWDCASLRKNHVECCKAKGVEEECLVYCSAENGVPTDYLKYVSCLEAFNPIKECFYEHLDKNPPFIKKHPKSPKH